MSLRKRASAAQSGGPARTRCSSRCIVPATQVAAMYAANKLWQEALDGYTALIRNKAAPQGAR